MEQPHISRIDGQGMWAAWTRNFGSPLLAAMDLIDNAFDAADKHTGIVEIEADRISVRRGLDDGITMTNNCKSPIPELQEVLMAYHSMKGSGEDSIGENGVGIKQGCATLADTSFILTKSNGRLQLGVIAYSLQKPTGIYLPHFDIDPMSSSLRDGLTEIAARNVEVGKIMVAYGIDRLEEHFIAILSDEAWAQSAHVFRLVLHDLKHGKGTVSSSLRDSPDKNKEDSKYAEEFMTTIAENLPLYYLHITDSFIVKVQGKRIRFSYWNARLAELTVFPVRIEHGGSATGQGYPLNLYLGFDVDRCVSKVPGTKKTARLIFHSRESGRKICQEDDARGILGLLSGSTNFCQGLCIIVDDSAGRFTLNPTKTDIAFASEPNGQKHKESLYEEISAATRAYYNHFFKPLGESKDNLTVAIGKARQTGDGSMKSFEESRFQEFHVKNWRTGPRQKKHLHPSDYEMVTFGRPGTTIKIELPTKSRAKEKARASRTTSTATSSKKATETHTKIKELEKKKRKLEEDCKKMQEQYKKQKAVLDGSKSSQKTSKARKRTVDSVSRNFSEPVAKKLGYNRPQNWNISDDPESLDDAQLRARIHQLETQEHKLKHELELSKMEARHQRDEIIHLKQMIRFLKNDDEDEASV